LGDLALLLAVVVAEALAVLTVFSQFFQPPYLQPSSDRCSAKVC
tara:strand:+ start:684 stop:815 length:132 start_codon:yes stop_codon:yes gene_type:complete